MKKHENRNRRRKCAVRKRQRRSISLDHRHTRAADASTELRRKCVVVLKTGHARGELPQLLRRRSQPPPKSSTCSANSEPCKIHGRICHSVTYRQNGDPQNHVSNAFMNLSCQSAATGFSSSTIRELRCFRAPNLR